MSGGAGVRRAIAVALVVTGLVRVGLAAAGAVAGATTSQQVPGESYGEFTGLTAADPTTLTHLTVSPGGQSIPLASTLGAYPGRTTATRDRPDSLRDGLEGDQSQEEQGLGRLVSPGRDAWWRRRAPLGWRRLAS